MKDPTTPGAQVTVPQHVIDELEGLNWLSSAAVAVVLGVVVAGLLSLGIVWLWRRRHHESHGWRVVWVSTVGVVLVLATVAVAVNSYVGYVPNASGMGKLVRGWIGHREVTSATDTRGRVEIVTMPAFEAGDIPELDAWVYTPPGYDAHPDVRYPVVYLVHGDPGQPSDWFVAGDAGGTMDVLLGHGLVEPMILVSINVNGGGGHRDTECLNWNDGPQVESWIYATVIPTVDESFRTVPDRSGRAIGGMSSGGFCALDQGLRHLDTWSVLLAFEGFGTPGDAGVQAFDGDQAAIDAHSPAVYLPTMDFDHPIAAYLDVGSRTEDVPDVRALARAIADRGQEVLFRVNPGESHTWSEVQAGLPYALVFASERLARS